MSFEETLVYYCAPTLTGLKSASMVSFSVKTEADEKVLKSTLSSYKSCFKCKGILFMELARQREHVLILFYRPKILKILFNSPQVREMLQQYDYPSTDELKKLLIHLKQRIAHCQSFPHEIGLFLGYPPKDVLSFIEHHGQDYLCCGYWKVYHNEDSARKLFASYAKCTKHGWKIIKSGGSIESVLCPAS